MQVRKILGGVECEQGRYSIGKLTNERYAVGNLFPGKTVAASQQFESLDAAFDYWYATLPSPKKSSVKPGIFMSRVGDCRQTTA